MIGKDINKAADVLAAGELVAIPTETVYGLAANALSSDAVIKIFEAKDRPHFDPLIVHVPDLEAAEKYVEHIPESARRLAAEFWPGPLTLLLPKKAIIPDIVTSGLGTVGIRCPNHEMTLSLLRKLAFPLAAPSANPFGYISPTTAAHVAAQLGEKVPYILDGGPCSVGIESTIISFEKPMPVILRRGSVTEEAIRAIIGPVEALDISTSNPSAPGQLESHYAPRKRLLLGDLAELLQRYPAHCSAVLAFQTDYNSPHQVILSREGSLKEAARNLFAALRELDQMGVDIILAEPVPDEGIGKAINDRLRRAASKGE